MFKSPDMRWTIVLPGPASHLLERAIKRRNESLDDDEQTMWEATIASIIASRVSEFIIEPADAKVKGDYIEEFEYIDEDDTEVMLAYRVYSVADGFARGKNGRCAFCDGDLRLEGDSNIARYMKASPWADTCPVCNGRPT